MSIKEEFEKLDAEIAEVEKQKHELHLKCVELEIKKEALFADYLLEEAILSQYTWHIKGEDRWCQLECSRRSSEWKVLSNLAETSWHCHKQIEKDINLYFDDGKIHISFAKGLSQMADFIKKHNIKIGVSEIKSKYEKLKKELAALEESFNLLHGDSK